MALRINTENVKALAAGELVDAKKRVLSILADDKITGFVARRLPSGKVSFGFRYRDKATGAQRWIALGVHGSVTAIEAREFAKKRAGEVADHRDPLAEQKESRAEAAKAKNADANTVDAVLDNFLARYVRKRGLRSADEIERSFKVYVRPRIGPKSIYDLKRSNIVAMLDEIEDKNGPVMADRVLAHVRKAFNWQAARDDQFLPPIVKGMARTKPAEHVRKRALTDEEIRDLWTALDQTSEPTLPEPYPAIVRAWLLTGQRCEEVSGMHWNEIKDEVWLIPAVRDKVKLGKAVPLTADVTKIIGTDGKGFVFSTTKGKRPFSGFSKAKAILDKRIADLRKKEGREAMPAWQAARDLRRTARTLMSRAGVTSDIAERVLGHLMPGVRGVYDVYAYLDEKRTALEALAGLVDRILHPKANVAQFPAKVAT